MRSLSRKAAPVSLLVAISILFGSVRTTYACGPFARTAIFVYSKHPDLPLERFASGELGVLSPTYARSYLIAGYRYASGIALTEPEQKSIVSLWNERLAFDWQDKAAGGKDDWLAARAKVPGVGPNPSIEVYRSAGKDSYESFLNCPADAFESSARTLAERVKQFGADSAVVKDWVLSQDKVFSNCASGETIPDPAADGTPVVRADREYQIAAANFYATKFDDAEKAFDHIASDATSSWRGVAPYLAARTLIRKASLGDAAHRTDALTQAETRLKKFLETSSAGPLHDSAANLLNLVKLRLHPQARLHELSQTLVTPGASADFKQDAWDYTVVMDSFLGDADDTFEESAKKNASILAQDDLSDWLRTFQSDDKEIVAHARDRWRDSKSPAWLIALILKTKGGDSWSSSLIDAANDIAPTSPSYATVSFHAIRLMMESGRRPDARKKLDLILGDSGAGLPLSARNEFLHQRMLLSVSLEEFLRFAQRTPAAFSWDDDGRQIPIDMKEVSEDSELRGLSGKALFDIDATRIINERFPLSMMIAAASDQTLPDLLRKRIAMAGWTRAVLLEDSESGKSLATVLSTLAPEMKTLLDTYSNAGTPAARKAAGIYALLKFPGTRPFVDSGVARLTPNAERDSYRDNWWCDKSSDSYAYDRSDEGDEATSEGTNKPGTNEEFPELDFLTAAQRESGIRERARVLALGAGPTYLAREAVAWAGRSPSDARVPEALHLAVVSTRYGCPDKNTGPLSKAAWQILHRRYANSVWTKKTPYWFKET